MRKSIAYGLCIIALLSISITAAPRTPIIERFTNIGCGYCPPCGAMVDSLSVFYGELLAVVEVHVSWTISSDPYYVAAAADCQSRWTHYGITGVPSVAIDGKKIGSWSTSPSVVNSRLYDIAPIALTIIPGDVIHVQVDVETPVSGTNNRLFVAAIEDSLYYPSAPNGEVWANNVLRKLLPSTAGQLVDLSTIGTQNFSFPLTLDPSWDTDRMKVVAWVQDWSASTASYCVHNAKVTDWQLMGYFHTLEAARIKEFAASDDTASFAVLLGNIGSYDDTYGVWIDADVPAGWDVWAEHGGTDFDSTGIALTSLASLDIDLHVIPSGSGGQGIVDMFIASDGDTSGAVDTVTFTVFAGGDLLYVAGPSAVTAIPYFEDLFADNGVDYHEWSISQDGALPDLSDAPYEAIVWHDAENLAASLSLQDRNSIVGFLENGGKMFVTSASWARTIGSIFDFYYMFIGAIGDGIDSSPSSVTGTYGGTEFTGYTATLGGSIAEGFTVSSPSRAILRLSSGKTCGLTRVTDGGGRLVYLSFMMEDIASATERDDLWDRVVEFWGGFDVDEVDITSTPDDFRIRAYPNPFNSAITISFDCGSKSPQALSTLPSGACRVEIFDLNGRMVYNNPVGSRLASTAGDADLAPTVHEIVWQPDATVGSGIYLVRAKVGDSEVTKRMVYLK